MPPALRPGPGSGPKLLGVLAGVVLALALVVTGRVLGGPDPPSPVRPPATGPVGCYATVADAAAAGYPQAPLPAGALELGGVYLVPVPEGVRRLVVAAARRPAAGALACAGARPVGEARVRGRVGGLVECPPSPSPHHEGLLLRWRDGGTFMALSVTGHLADVRRLVLALATHLELAPA
jgi:hypothetical protein